MTKLAPRDGDNGVDARARARARSRRERQREGKNAPMICHRARGIFRQGDSSIAATRSTGRVARGQCLNGASLLSFEPRFGDREDGRVVVLSQISTTSLRCKVGQKTTSKSRRTSGQVKYSCIIAEGLLVVAARDGRLGERLQILLTAEPAVCQQLWNPQTPNSTSK
jgi:hypothetical protein